jgi:hypothetical protein
MNDFERALFGESAQIPLHEASAYFIDVRRSVPKVASAKRGLSKTAGWQDPPDSTGMLEGSFDVPVEQAVSLMGKCAYGLLRIMNACLIYGRSIRGPQASEVRSVINRCEWEHKSSFEYLVERMAVLAGAPHIPDVDMAPASTDPVSVAQRLIRAEQELIQDYHVLCSVLGENPMKCEVRRFMSECQRHVDAYWQALPVELGTGLAPSAPAPMEAPEEEAFETADMELPEEYEEEPAPDVKTAALRMVKWAKETPTDAELRESGRQSAVKTIAAEHGREKARRGERAGRTLGMLAGAAGGGALGHRLGKGNPAATLGGAALGGFAGRGVGSELGTEVDIARGKGKKADITKAAAAMVRWVKQADTMGGTAEAEAPMASPTDNQELAPVNYLQAEMLGQQAQNNAEANYYRAQAAQAQQAAAEAQQQAQMQVQQVQQEAMQAQQDAAMAEQKVKAALDEAVRAKDDALKQTETAAQLRIAQQDMRMKLMEFASMDPAMSAAMNLAQTTGQATPLGQPMGEVMSPDAALSNEQAEPTAGPAGEAPDQQTAPGAQPPAGAPDMNANAGGAPGPDPSMAQSASALKMGGARRRPFDKAAGVIGAGLGAGLGGIDRALQVRRGLAEGVAPVQERISQLEGAQDGSYGAAAALAKAKTNLANRELALAHPGQVALRQIGSGAVKGGILGHAIEDRGRALYNLLSDQ